MATYNEVDPIPVPSGKSFSNLYDDVETYIVLNTTGAITAPVAHNMFKNIINSIPLSGATNFNISSTQTNDYLRYNGSKWENSQNLIIDGTSTLNDDLTVNANLDVNGWISGTTFYLSGQYVNYIQSSSGVSNSTTTLLTEEAIVNMLYKQNELGELTDVSLSSTQSGDTLYYSGGTWVNVEGLSKIDADNRYVNITGDTMTGNLTISIGGLNVTGETNIVGNFNLSGDTFLNGNLTLPSGTSIYDISTDSGFTTDSDNQIATTKATKEYIADYISLSALTDTIINNPTSGYTQAGWGYPYENYQAKDSIFYQNGKWINQLTWDAEQIIDITQDLRNLEDITDDIIDNIFSEDVFVNKRGITDYPNSDSKGDLILVNDGDSGMTWQPSIIWASNISTNNILKESLRSYWTLDNTLIDSEGVSNLISGGTYINYFSGKINQALSGDSTLTVNYINQGLSSYSVSLWLQSGSTDETIYIISGETLWNKLYIDSNILTFDYMETGSTLQTTGLTTIDNNLNHYVVSYDKDTTTLNIYENSINIYSSNLIDMEVASYENYNLSFGSGNTYDEIGFWLRDLQNEEVEQLYNSDSGLSYTEFKFGNEVDSKFTNATIQYSGITNGEGDIIFNIWDGDILSKNSIFGQNINFYNNTIVGNNDLINLDDYIDNNYLITLSSSTFPPSNIENIFDENTSTSSTFGDLSQLKIETNKYIKYIYLEYDVDLSGAYFKIMINKGLSNEEVIINLPSNSKIFEKVSINKYCENIYIEFFSSSGSDNGNIYRIFVYQNTPSMIVGDSNTISGNSFYSNILGEGLEVIDNTHCTAVGKYNYSGRTSGDNVLFVVGNGTGSGSTERSDAFVITSGSSSIYMNSDVYVSNNLYVNNLESTITSTSSDFLVSGNTYLYDSIKSDITIDNRSLYLYDVDNNYVPNYELFTSSTFNSTGWDFDNLIYAFDSFPFDIQTNQWGDDLSLLRIWFEQNINDVTYTLNTNNIVNITIDFEGTNLLDLSFEIRYYDGVNWVTIYESNTNNYVTENISFSLEYGLGRKLSFRNTNSSSTTNIPFILNTLNIEESTVDFNYDVYVSGQTYNDYITTNKTTIKEVLNLQPYNNSSPTDGDLWYDGSNLYFISGTTTKTISWT